MSASDKFGQGGRMGPGRFPASEKHIVHPKASGRTCLMDAIIWGAIIIVAAAVVIAVVL